MKNKDVHVPDENDQVEETTPDEVTDVTPEETIDESVEDKKEVVEETEENKEDVNLEEKPKERPVYHMPVAKAQKEKEKAVAKALEERQKEFEGEIKGIHDEYAKSNNSVSTQQANSDVVDKLESFADDNGIDKKVLSGLVDVIKGQLIMPDLSKYEDILKENEIEGQKLSVRNEFDESIAPIMLKDFPSASKEHLTKIKNEIEQLAFSPRYNTYSLEDIYLIHKNKFSYQDKQTLKDTGSRTLASDGNIEDLSDDEAMKLPPEQYGVWVRAKAASQSKYL